MMNKKIVFTISICLVSVLFSCKKDSDIDPTTASTEATNLIINDVKINYSNIVYASYEDSYNLALNLKNKINEFTLNPTEQNLEEARKSWLEAREPYGQTESYRFYGGPIDNDEGPEGYINSWPCDEAYVDYVKDNPSSGIINKSSLYPTIDKALLLSLNQSGSEENVATGYHAIEFLLWGQDTLNTNTGNRKYTDYIDNGTNNANRRATYLKICAELLVDYLNQLKNEWKDGVSDNYRNEFINMENTLSLRKMYLGATILAHNELAGERIFVAYETQNQEDEHSCFSDNTDRDIFLNFKGISNVYYGEYKRIDGTIIKGKSIRDLIGIKSSESQISIDNSIVKCENTIKNIPHPFDQSIINNRSNVLNSVDELKNLGVKLKESALLFSIDIEL